MNLFGRNSRRSARFQRWALGEFAPTFRIGGVHFDTPEGDGEGDDTTPAPAGGTGTGTAPANRGSGAAADGGAALAKALKERKKAKALANTLLRGMGIDPEQVKTVSTGDPANPLRIEGVPDLDQRLTLARAVGSAGGGAGRGKGAQSVEVATLTAQVNGARKQIAALIKFINRTATVDPIRAACVKYHAIDDDGGQFEDIVNALAPFFRPNVEIDPEDAEAEPEVSVLCVQRDGTPYINPATNQPHTPDTLVQAYLTRKPHMRQANFRGGPGAGGSTVGSNPRRPAAVQTTPNGNGNGNGDYDDSSAEARTAQAVADLTGGAVTPRDLMAQRRGR